MILKFLKLINFLTNYFFNFKFLRFNQHLNGTCVIKYHDKYLKVSFSKYGKYLINNEIKGYNWYLKKIKLIEKLKFKKTFLFSQIKTDQFRGVKKSYKDNVVTNSNFILLALKHYEKVWEKKNKVFCHGDLTFENIIFDENNNKTYFIDWENFKVKKEDWGFDIVYLLLSSLILPNINKKEINQKDLKCFSSLWSKIKRKIKSPKMKKNPLLYFDEKFKKDIYWKNLSKNAPRKFFINVMSKKLRLEIIKIFDK